MRAVLIAPDGRVEMLDLRSAEDYRHAGPAVLERDVTAATDDIVGPAPDGRPMTLLGMAPEVDMFALARPVLTGPEILILGLAVPAEDEEPSVAGPINRPGQAAWVALVAEALPVGTLRPEDIADARGGDHLYGPLVLVGLRESDGLAVPTDVTDAQVATIRSAVATVRVPA